MAEPRWSIMTVLYLASMPRIARNCRLLRPAGAMMPLTRALGGDGAVPAVGGVVRPALTLELGSAPR